MAIGSNRTIKLNPTTQHAYAKQQKSNEFGGKLVSFFMQIHICTFRGEPINVKRKFFFADHIFAPNQTVNLSELESEEREIESFKRFNYYFEPPKNKPKINLNVKEIVLNKKMSSSNGPSPQPITSCMPLPHQMPLSMPPQSPLSNLSTASSAANTAYPDDIEMDMFGGGPSQQSFLDLLKNYGTIGSEMKMKYGIDNAN